nr:uncharacterized protein LOC131769742 [Pocillopora verrucosa]
MTHLSVELTFDTASFMLTPESTGFQKDQQQKDSDTSATAGSIVHPETEEPQALLKFKVLSLVAMNYFEMAPPQSLEELNEFEEYLREVKAILGGVSYEASFMLTPESTGFQKDQQQKDSDTSATAGSIVHPETEEPQALLKFKVLSLVAMNYFEMAPPQSLEELNEFEEYLREVKAILGGVSYEGSLVISVECDSLEMLEGTHIVFVNSARKITDREMTHLSVELTFDTASFMLTPESTGFQKDQQQKDSDTSATAGSIVHPETEDPQALQQFKFLSLVAMKYLKIIFPQSLEELDEFIENLREVKAIIAAVSYEGTSPSSDMFTISHEKEQELPETMRHQERKASFMLTPESTGFQKDQQQKDSDTSATAGSIVHPETEDPQALLKLIAMNYLEIPPPQSLEELKHFKEYLRRMKEIIGVPYEASFMLTPESTGFQKDQQQKDSDTSATAGSIVHPETEEPQALLKFKVLSLVAMNYFEMAPPQSLEELNEFEEYLREVKAILGGVSYEASFMLTPESTGFQKDQQQKDSDTSATAGSIVHPETEDPQALLKLIAMNYLEITPPQSLKELKHFKEYLRRMKEIIGVPYEASFMLTPESTGFQKDQQQKDSNTSATAGSIVHPETEDPQALLKFKVLFSIAQNCLENISPQSMEEWNNLIEYLSKVKAVIAGVSYEEAAGFQKDQHQASAASTTAGSILHPKTKDFLALKQKILQLSAMNYFKTTPLHSIKESNEFKFSIGNNKISVGKSKITKDGGVLIVQNVPSRVMFPPKALSTCTEVTCSLWNLQILSPPLGRNEALVSSVMELACGSLLGTEKRYEFNVKVKLALSYSASDIKGYELVIKELINEKTNDWRDLETRWAWTSSDIKDEHSSVEEFPDWLFPFAEAEITRFSSFAVVWRLKSFTFKSPSTLSSSFPCILSDHPGVSVTLPVSSLPTGKTFALTVKLHLSLKVQEIPCNDTVLKELVVAGPILHISPSEPVQLLAPTRLTIPVSLREDIPKFPDYSATDIRIFCRTSEEDESEWNEVTEQLENKAVLKNGTVTFTVNHFSMYWVWIDLLKLPFDILKHLVDYLSGKSMLQRVGFFARLYAIENSTNYVLTLYCFPLHLEEQVHTRTSSTDHCVRAQGEGNSLKPLCKEDQMSVSLSKAFTVTQEENLDNFLTFLGTEPFKRSLRVSVSDLRNLQVELYMGNQDYRQTLCTLYFIPTSSDQSSSPRNSPSAAQVVMREQREDQGFSTALPSPKAPEGTDSSNSLKEDLKVIILADEWNSLKGGLSTFNRELAIHLASRSGTQVTVFVPHCACGEEEKAAAAENRITIIEAEKCIACSPLEELFFLPKGHPIDVVIGHGVKLGKQAQIIRKNHDCKWVQVVHTAPDELGMYKDYPKAVAQSEEKNQREVSLCETADLVMAVGPKLKGFYSNHLRSFNKDQNVVQFTPGIMKDLTDVELSLHENDEFQVLMFGRGDDEDFELKGYDVAAEAFASPELKNDSYHLTFVGAALGKQDEFAAKVLQHGISKNQLSVKEYIKDRNRLKELLLRMDLVIMPSRTEGFGLTALEALSAGLPVLAGHNSGFSKALREVEFGELCVVNSDKPEDWSKAIKKVRQKERKKRLKEMQRLRESYERNYNWEEQCEILLREMRRKVFA